VDYFFHPARTGKQLVYTTMTCRGNYYIINKSMLIYSQAIWRRLFIDTRFYNIISNLDFSRLPMFNDVIFKSFFIHVVPSR